MIVDRCRKFFGRSGGTHLLLPMPPSMRSRNSVLGETFRQMDLLHWWSLRAMPMSV